MSTGIGTPPRRSASQRKFRPRAKSLLLGIVAFAALFGAGYAIAVFLLFPPPAAPENGISVPSLKGMTVAEAHERLRQSNLTLGDTLPMPHATAQPGLVVAQDPLPGQQLRSGAHVNLGVSSGQPSQTVPDLVGLGARRAQNLLERLGFEVAQTLESSDRANGTVLRSVPEPGTRQTLPARVVLFVSSGQAADTVQVDTLKRDTIHTR